jgi:anaerobic ribonucleoside-triphosphate reductase activating protein
MRFRLHDFEPASRANGPGLRAVVWFQGCTLGCAGCFNPATQDPSGGEDADTQTLADQIAALRGIDGVSISGGEPFQQLEALADLVRRVRATPLGILVFSGYAIDHIRRMPLGPDILSGIDVLVDGPYVEAQHAGRNLLGSTNQRIHILAARSTLADLATVAQREVIIHRDGSITLSGIGRPVHPITSSGNSS